MERRANDGDTTIEASLYLLDYIRKSKSKALATIFQIGRSFRCSHGGKLQLSRLIQQSFIGFGLLF